MAVVNHRKQVKIAKFFFFFFLALVEAAQWERRPAIYNNLNSLEIQQGSPTIITVCKPHGRSLPAMTVFL